jgi:hypothetical protein
METKIHSQQPDFSSLTAVMKRFNEVPYSQFQKELNDFFDCNFTSAAEKLDAEQQAVALKFKNSIMQLATDLFGQADAVEQCKDLLK